MKKLETIELNRDIQLDKDVELLISNKNKKIEIYEKELATLMKQKKQKEIIAEEMNNDYDQMKVNYDELQLKYK